MIERTKTIGFRARTLYLAIKRAVDGAKNNKGNGCTNTHGWVIGYLYDNRRRDVYQKDIEKQFGVRRPTMTEILKLMEKNGLVERVRDEQDARLKKIKLTPLALEIHEKHERDIDNFERYIRQGISEREMNVFFEVMDKISANIERFESKEI